MVRRFRDRLLAFIQQQAIPKVCLSAGMVLDRMLIIVLHDLLQLVRKGLVVVSRRGFPLRLVYEGERGRCQLRILLWSCITRLISSDSSSKSELKPLTM